METDADFILVSDFHLTTGKNDLTGKVDGREEFFSDAPFAHLLDALLDRARKENRRWRLVLLGDVFDFLRVRLRTEKITQVDTSILAAGQKLERIAAGHPVFFDALRRFLAHGHQIDILPGNHDLEWIRTETQEVMKDLLAGSTAPARFQIAFHPWILHIPGLLYAEHGQQYHSVNALPALLAPFQHGNRDRLALPFGSHLETYLFDLLEAVFPNQEMQPGLSVIAKAVREKPGRLLSLLPLHTRFLATMVRSTAGSLVLAGPRASKNYELQVLPTYSREIRISTKSLLSIHQLSSTNILSRLPHLFRSRSEPVTAHYLYLASQKINALLENEDRQVPFYVFGHTHSPVKAQIHPARTEAHYLNCGSWAGRHHQIYPFIEILHETKRSPKAASLLLWDEQARRIIPYRRSPG